MTISHPIAFKTIPSFSVIKRTYPELKGLFFDMDGTLFNTEPYHTDAMLKLAHKYNIKAPFSIEVVHELLVGKADHLVFDIIKQWQGFPKNWSVTDFVNTKSTYLLEILQDVEPKGYFPDEIKNLLETAKAEGLYLALVTSSEKVITDRLMELAGIEELFHLRLTRDDCPLHKPHPWPYLEALKACGHSPHEVIIFEDSSVGLQAAKASGSHVIKVEWY
jgi:beta-phosphoglucomutase